MRRSGTFIGDIIVEAFKPTLSYVRRLPSLTLGRIFLPRNRGGDKRMYLTLEQFVLLVSLIVAILTFFMTYNDRN